MLIVLIVCFVNVNIVVEHEAIVKRAEEKTVL